MIIFLFKGQQIDRYMIMYLIKGQCMDRNILDHHISSQGVVDRQILDHKSKTGVDRQIKDHGFQGYFKCLTCKKDTQIILKQLVEHFLELQYNTMSRFYSNITVQQRLIQSGFSHVFVVYSKPIEIVSISFQLSHYPIREMNPLIGANSSMKLL